VNARLSDAEIPEGKPLNTNPFFSVLVPTKNRSHLVGYAIQSVLNQSFDDYEIVVADNDDTEATAEVVAAFQDKRIRYFRTGNLSMADNWEYACRRARGEFITVLEDKAAFCPYALERIHRILTTRNNCQVVVWQHDRLDDTQSPPVLHRYVGSGKEFLYSSEEVIKSFVSQPRAISGRIMPRSLNSCCHKSIIQRAQASPVGRFFAPLNPDLVAAFLQLEFAETIVYLDLSLSVLGTKHSNGYACSRNIENIKAFLRESGFSEEDAYDMVPIKSVTLASSSLIYNDYLRIRKQIGGKLQRYPLDIVNYFVRCYNDLQFSKGLGADITDEESIWSTTLAKQPVVIQNAVWQRLKPSAPNSGAFFKKTIKQIARKVGIGRILRIWLPYRKTLPYWETYVGQFSNVLEAATCELL
jgi:glycosyltransferase involved in cell wall biosynthesis